MSFHDAISSDASKIVSPGEFGEVVVFKPGSPSARTANAFVERVDPTDFESGSVVGIGYELAVDATGLASVMVGDVFEVRGQTCVVKTVHDTFGGLLELYVVLGGTS